MEIRKCTKCGAFMMSEGDICSSCAKEIAYENTVLKNYFDENSSFDSIPSISAITGISPNTIKDYMKTNNYVSYDNSFNNIQY